MSSSCLILAIDTASSCSSIAITRGTPENGDVLAALSLNSRVTHSRRILGAIDWLMSQAGFEIEDFSAFAVGLGPGSFTGLRIGMACVKGLCVAAEKPLLGISTLDGLAFSCSAERLICAVLDARKKEVYSAFYQRTKGNAVERLSPIRALAPQKLIDEINEPVLLVGDGLLAYGELFRKGLGSRYQAAPRSLMHSSAVGVGLLVAEKYERGEYLDPAASSPMYVRASDAELSLGIKK